jgi:AcrR family transcriptional regulator
MSTATARIKQGRKVDQVIDGARLVFMEQGYARASMDEIARVAGVSKATLYTYFVDKRALFSEMYRSEIQRVADGAVDVLLPDADPEIALSAAAERILAYLTSDFGLAMYRICVSESPRFPEIGAAFYESGPEMGRARLGAYLEAAVARGVLVIPDIDLAADQFFQLCQTTLCDRMICGVQHQFTEPEIARTIKGAVSMFLAAYRPRP